MPEAPTVLVADKLETQAIEGMRALGCNVVVEPDLDGGSLPDAVRRVSPGVIVVRSTKVPAAAIEAGEQLVGVIRAGSGYDNVDVAAADAKGVSVCNCPGMNAVAVAELTIGHMVSLDRRLPAQDAALKAGTWNKKEYSKARGLKGRSLLVIGTGSIGTEVIRRAQAFGMHVYAQSRRLGDDTARALDITPLSYTREALYEALPKMDVVSVHVASTPDTRDLCDAAFFGAMQPGALFINTSRGDIVDEAALVEAVKSRGIRAALDVYRDQPSDKHTQWSPAVAGLEGVQCSHHCGASTDQAQEAVADEVVRIVKVYTETGRFENLVNTPS